MPCPYLPVRISDNRIARGFPVPDLRCALYDSSAVSWTSLDTDTQTCAAVERMARDLDNVVTSEFSVAELWVLLNKRKTADHKRTTNKDEEVAVSKSGVDELWNRLAVSVVEEVLGYLDVRALHRLSRVSKPWKESMSRYGVINSGVVFLTSPSYYDQDSRLLTAKLLGEHTWSRVFRLKPNTMKHFVFVGKSMPFSEGRPFGKLSALFHPLRRVTFHSVTIDSNQLHDVARCILIHMDSVQFVKCTFQVQMIRQHSMPTFTWWSNFLVPVMKLTKANLESVGRPQLVHTLDAMGLIWPYGQKQLKWLKKSLDSLRGIRWTTIHMPDEDYRNARARTYGKNNVFRKLNVRSCGLKDGRELDTLDAAFLMRLLLWLKKTGNVEVDDISRPPYEIPDFEDLRM